MGVMQLIGNKWLMWGKGGECAPDAADKGKGWLIGTKRLIGKSRAVVRIWGPLNKPDQGPILKISC